MNKTIAPLYGQPISTGLGEVTVFVYQDLLSCSANCYRIEESDVQREIKRELVGAESAVKKVLLWWEQRFCLSESDIANQKADELRDLARRHLLDTVGIDSLSVVPPLIPRIKESIRNKEEKKV